MVYHLSFFEEERAVIAARLRLGAAVEPSPDQGEPSGLQPRSPGPATSTPLPLPSRGRVPEAGASSAGVREAAATTGPAPAPGQPGCLPRPAAGGGRGPRPALSRRARRAPGQPSGGGPGTPARSRLGLPRTRASRGLQVLEAGTGHCAREIRLLRSPGTRLKLTSLARSTLQGASRVSQQAQPSSLPKLNPRERGMKDAAKVGSGEQPSSRLPTEIPTLASRSSLQPPSKWFCLHKESTTEELVLNRTRELKEDDEGKERLVAASIVLGAGQNEQTLERVESSLSSELDPGLTSGREDSVPGEQSAGAQLTQELERLKKDLEHAMKEMERVKGRTDLVLGVCQKDAAVFQQQ